MATTIYRSDVSPLTEFDSLSIPQWITQYNPDLVLADKVVHSDDFSNDVITYGSLRHDASRLAWGLRNKLGVKEGDIVLALVPNSVLIPSRTRRMKMSANRPPRRMTLYY